MGSSSGELQKSTQPQCRYGRIVNCTSISGADTCSILRMKCLDASSKAEHPAAGAGLGVGFGRSITRYGQKTTWLSNDPSSSISSFSTSSRALSCLLSALPILIFSFRPSVPDHIWGNATESGYLLIVGNAHQPRGLVSHCDKREQDINIYQFHQAEHQTVPRPLQPGHIPPFFSPLPSHSSQIGILAIIQLGIEVY